MYSEFLMKRLRALVVAFVGVAYFDFEKQRTMFPNADNLLATYLALKANQLSGAIRDGKVILGADEVRLRKETYDGILPPTAAGCQREIIDLGRGAFHFPRHV